MIHDSKVHNDGESRRHFNKAVITEVQDNETLLSKKKEVKDAK